MAQLVEAYRDRFPAVRDSGAAGWGCEWGDVVVGVGAEDKSDAYGVCARSYVACLQVRKRVQPSMKKKRKLLLTFTQLLFRQRCWKLT